MKKFVIRVGLLLAASLGIMLYLPVPAEAKTADTFKEGVYAEEVSLGGMTMDEAKAAIEAYIDSLEAVEITLVLADAQEVPVTAGDFGICWSNPEILEDAIRLGTDGNIVERYKAMEDLACENKIYPIELDFEITDIDAVLAEKCSDFDREAIDYELIRENGAFQIIEGQTGYFLDVENSIDTIYAYMNEQWNREEASIALNVVITEPRGSVDELSRVTDVLGTFTTSYSTSGSSRSANVENGTDLINGALLYPGDEFSTYEEVSPFTKGNGYHMAGSYVNGKVVDSLGGGICQVSTTLYNAVLLAELEVTERHNHSMIVNYVDASADAAIAESSGKDFRFVNNTDYPIYVEGITTSNKKITFNIYGVETRPEGRTVEYVSEVLETIYPQTDALYPDAGQQIGYIKVSSAHIGYKAKLWKVVKEDGVEVSRELVNSSSYKMSPRSAVVGVATADPVAYNEIMAAIGTNSIDHVKNVIALLVPPATDANAVPAQ